MSANQEGNRRTFSTLQMIADELHLSVSTVSRVLNGSSEAARRAASEETADAIRELAARIGYSPNPHARSWRLRRSGEIGVLVPRVSDLVLATIYEGVHLSVAAHGFQAFLANTYDCPELHDSAIRAMVGRRVDGIIIGDSRLDRPTEEVIAESGVPFVCMNRRSPHSPSVTCDDFTGGALVADHLLSMGHRDVSVVAGARYASTGADRTAGFVEAYRQRGIEVKAENIEHSSFDTAGGHRAAEARLKRNPGITAIFAVNDFTAIGVMGALRDRGLVPGMDVAVVGFNDVPLASELSIALSSVRSPMSDIGRLAGDLLVKAIRGQTVASETLTPSLVVRQSSSLRVGADLSVGHRLTRGRRTRE